MVSDPIPVINDVDSIEIFSRHQILNLVEEGLMTEQELVVFDTKYNFSDSGKTWSFSDFIWGLSIYKCDEFLDFTIPPDRFGRYTYIKGLTPKSTVKIIERLPPIVKFFSFDLETLRLRMKNFCLINNFKQVSLNIHNETILDIMKTGHTLRQTVELDGSEVFWLDYEGSQIPVSSEIAKSFLCSLEENDQF